MEQQQLRKDATPQNVRFNQADLIIFSAFYFKWHVTYFRPQSDLTVINCNLCRFLFNALTGLIKKKKEHNKNKPTGQSLMLKNPKPIMYQLSLCIIPPNYCISNTAPG